MWRENWMLYIYLTREKSSLLVLWDANKSTDPVFINESKIWVLGPSKKSYFAFISNFYIYFLYPFSKCENKNHWVSCLALNSFIFYFLYIINFGTWFLHMRKGYLSHWNAQSLQFFFFTKVTLNSFCWKWKCQKVVFSYSVFILTFFGYWKKKKKEGFSLVDLTENRK